MNDTPDNIETYLLQAMQARDSTQRQSLFHIGALYAETDGKFVIRNLLQGYPAINAGLQYGDVILSSNGDAFHPVHSFNADGQPHNREYQLTLLRNGLQRQVALRPVHENLFDSFRRATTNSISQSPAGNKLVCYVHWWVASRALNDLITDRGIFASLRNCDGLILDLRDAVGYFDWQHLDHFFDTRNNFPVLTLHSPDSEITLPPPARDAYTSQQAFQRPMAILVNRGTRGGMELLARHLIQSGRAISVGTATAGIVSHAVAPGNFQKVDGLLYGPGHTISVNGVNPDKEITTPAIILEWSLQESSATDPQFDVALYELMRNI